MTSQVAVGLLILSVMQLVIDSAVVFAIRRRKRIAPSWSWPKVVGRVGLLILVVMALSFIPVAGRYAAVVVFLVGLKRITGLDVPATFILSFCLGLIFILFAAIIGHQLGVDLLAEGN